LAGAFLALKPIAAAVLAALGAAVLFLALQDEKSA
jgi:hypothetical protein